MSDSVRIALVAEGITDYVFLNAAIESMLAGQSFNLKLLQPEESVAFTGGGDAGLLGGGWKGVYKWCLQAADRAGGKLNGDDPLFLEFDILVLHLDADVAAEDPANYPVNPITALAGILPCEQPCPPPHHTTDRLRHILLSWIGESQAPPQTVLCTPSKSTEAWVVAIFFPRDREMNKKGWECHADPSSRLAQQKKADRFSKRHTDYQKRHQDFINGWPRIAGHLTEAQRFHEEFSAVVSGLSD